jgi:GNAT superfamily N-acetyltransferase
MTGRIKKASITRNVDVIKTARVLQMEGMFDVPPDKRSNESWTVEFTLPKKWNVGVIVGPSGSGKTTIANELFGDSIVDYDDWDPDMSVLDAFPDGMSIKDIVKLLSSVGFSSPPSWVRPYRVLSTGEQFRVSVARMLAEKEELAVVDEFTSVVDRTVAKVGSAAIAKTVRGREQKLIAVSCHYDILDWLEPDWVYQPHTGEYYVGRYLHQRPSIHIDVRKVHHSAWHLFRKFHYLDANLNKAAHCFIGYVEDNPAVFCGMLPFPHATRSGWRISRLVTLPDYQGIGLGAAMGDFVAGAFITYARKPVFITMLHPALVHSYARSPDWRLIRAPSRTAKIGKTSKIKGMGKTVSSTRLTTSFEYIGAPASEELVADLFGIAARSK